MAGRKESEQNPDKDLDVVIKLYTKYTENAAEITRLKSLVSESGTPQSGEQKVERRVIIENISNLEKQQAYIDESVKPFIDNMASHNFSDKNFDYLQLQANQVEADINKLRGEITNIRSAKQQLRNEIPRISVTKKQKAVVREKEFHIDGLTLREKDLTDQINVLEKKQFGLSKLINDVADQIMNNQILLEPDEFKGLVRDLGTILASDSSSIEDLNMAVKTAKEMNDFITENFAGTVKDLQSLPNEMKQRIHENVSGLTQDLATKAQELERKAELVAQKENPDQKDKGKWVKRMASNENLRSAEKGGLTIGRASKGWVEEGAGNAKKAVEQERERRSSADSRNPPTITPSGSSKD